jgi:tripartite-type tricarboxylate transporter receptor subunit TctC
MFPATIASIEYIRAGRLHALAVTTATCWEALPDLPTAGEFVPGYEASAWFGIGAPKNMPTEIVDKLNKEVNAALAPRSWLWLRAQQARIDLGGNGNMLDQFPGAAEVYGPGAIRSPAPAA